MGLLDNKMKQRNTATRTPEPASRIPRERLENPIPVYGSDGTVLNEQKRSRKWMVVTGGIILFLILLIWVPGWIYSRPETPNRIIGSTNTSVISEMKEFIKGRPSDDTDGDGLLNSEELTSSTSARQPDTDLDGVSDYIEKYVTGTDPTRADDTLDRTMQQKLNAEGKNVSTPFAVGDVIFWADNLASRAHGSVIATRSGYRFCRFTGWVQFASGGYAYKYENGIHTLLDHREEEDAWYIDGEYEVIVTPSPLEETYQLSFFNGHPVYLQEGFIGRALEFLLPSDSYLVGCKKITMRDTYVDTSDIVVNDITPAVFTEEDASRRFGVNMTKLEDLANVYSILDSGACVQAALIDTVYGEEQVIIYGYDASGNLFVADTEDFEKTALIEVEARSEQCLTEDMDFAVRTWFEFRGAGYDSMRTRAMINFFAASVPGAIQSGPEPETEPETEEVTEPETEEETTEPPTEKETTDPDAYADTPKDAEYYDDVVWAKKNGYLSASEEDFHPEATITKQFLVTFLWKMAGRPSASETFVNPCVDLDVTQDSGKAALWALEWRLINASPEGKADLSAGLTRSEAAGIIWMYTGGVDSTLIDSPYKDVDQTNPFYRAIYWLNEHDIIEKTETFKPDDKALRQDVIIWLHNLSVYEERRANEPETTTAAPTEPETAPAEEYYNDNYYNDYYYEPEAPAYEEPYIPPEPQTTAFGDPVETTKAH